MTYMQEWDSDAIDPDTGERTGDYVNIPGTDNWKRHWLDHPVKSGVFLTPNPLDIAINHGRSGHVYAYRVPEWVIAKSGGLHRYDTGSEVLVPEDIWNGAGKEIEFLGKSMDKEELWDKMMGSMYGPGHHRPPTKPSWMSDEELKQWQVGQDTFNLAGLRATNHPEDVIKLLKPEEKRKAVEAIMAKKEDRPGFIEKGPRDKKGIVVPPFGQTLDKKDQELLALLQKHIKEARIRKIIIENLPPWMIDAIRQREEQEDRKKEIGRRLPLHRPPPPPPEEKEYQDPEDDPSVVDYSLQQEIRNYVRAIFEANEYGWKVSSKKNMMLDKDGMEQQDKDNQEKFLKSMSMMEVQEYISELLVEDADPSGVTVRVQNYGNGVAAAIMMSGMRIGSATAREVLSYEHCTEDVEKLKDQGYDYNNPKFPTLGPTLYAIGESHVDEAFRGFGYGKKLYKAIIDEIGKHVGNRGAFVGADECAAGSTSEAAQRVWKSVGRDYPSSGNVVYVGPK